MFNKNNSQNIQYDPFKYKIQKHVKVNNMLVKDTQVIKLERKARE